MLVKTWLFSVAAHMVRNSSFYIQRKFYFIQRNIYSEKILLHSEKRFHIQSGFKEI